MVDENLGRVKCLDCNYDGYQLGKDECYNCGYRYHPNTNGNSELCLKCGEDDYYYHCPKCDSDNVVNYQEYEDMQETE